VAGCDLRKNPVGVRKRIGYVAQGGGSTPELKVLEEMVLQARFYGLTKADGERRSVELMKRLDIADLDDRIIKTLSGGQRRRLDVALGLVHDPRLVFLDEPSTGLDPQSRANLWGHIRSLRDEHDTTVFLTTHYLDEADALCDRILVIDHGQIVAEGTPDELKSRVSGDEVRVGVSAEDLTRAAELAENLPGAGEISTVDTTVRFRVPRGDAALPELLRAMDAQGIPMESIQVHRPTLDDVFLTMTGRSLRDAEQEIDAEPQGKEPANVA
jgi:ABC-2 type transport system ATP-binding protein